MEKQLKDYLHLYLGCECVVYYEDDEHILKLIGVQLRYVEVFYQGYSNSVEFENIKPILRPLSDMTHKENFNAVEPMRYGLKTIEGYELLRQAGEMSKYLLSKHFDLFGLIEAGLAIDATTLNTAPTIEIN